MNILVIGGMHGNETLGIDLVKNLQNNPLQNVSCVLANTEAIAANKRFTGEDLNRSFPGKTSGKTYEQRRAAELLKICEKYDVVLDFHNTYCPENDCTFIGDSADKMLLGVAQFIGLPRVIVADYDCINKYSPNCISVEISMQSRLNDVQLWRDIVQRLSQQNPSILQDTSQVETFRFVYRMTLEDKSRWQLDQKNLRAFQPIDPEIATNLGVASPAYPIFINDKFTPYNYGGLLNKLRR